MAIGAILIGVAYMVGSSNNGGTDAFAQSAGTATVRWEYRVTGTEIINSQGLPGGHHGHTGIEEMLNRLGSEGWELVAVSGAGPGSASRLILKRPRR